ncbi:uncharacterized protein LOC116250492 [Nymphaea colorata]|uniref:Uncharacterized protein n=1 Tax=Nymphaea colorata TaxID=210225 RepID=A0A5K0V9C1_9MAGN|nr:uncharacterized protein LOC116250492 [Nymphaea colorata]XP_031480005.1 uncharacterized protein LOC116250492 [Nymphaea colorata]XP_031480013.1 uncharacterized protein LOC116250492 [Nymphaea colorata]
MGNKPATPKRDEILVKVMPPIDQTLVRWIARDVDRIYGFVPKKPRAIKPPEHYIEYMRLQGWLDVDLDDAELARLLK